MTAKNTLIQAPPYAVELAIKRLGSNLRTARLRRNLTIEEVGEKIVTGPRAVSDAEKGKVSTGNIWGRSKNYSCRSRGFGPLFWWV